MRRNILLLVAATAIALTAQPVAKQTALDRYVAAPDPNFKWELVNTIEGKGYKAYVLDMISLEADLVVEQGLAAGRVGLVQVKSSRTLHGEHLRPVQRVREMLGDRVERCMLIHDGDEHYLREGVEVVGLHARKDLETSTGRMR